jgi:hypothetical protein
VLDERASPVVLLAAATRTINILREEERESYVYID